jgi:hypothetical protein
MACKLPGGGQFLFTQFLHHITYSSIHAFFSVGMEKTILIDVRHFKS